MFSERILGTVGLQGSEHSRGVGNGHVTVAGPVMADNQSRGDASGAKSQVPFRGRLFYY